MSEEDRKKYEDEIHENEEKHKKHDPVSNHFFHNTFSI